MAATGILASSSALSMVGWFIIPQLATYYIQLIYYKITIPLGDSVPLAGSPKYETHKRKINAAVITLYLVFSVVESVWNVTNDLSPQSTRNSLYGALGLDPDVTASGLRSAFRRLSLKFHPDKATGSGLEVEEKWLSIKASYDMLSNPVMRFAYDRFGDKSMAWSNKFENLGASKAEGVASTMADFVMLGIKESLFGYYGGSFLVFCFMALFGLAKTGHPWRFFILITGFMIELSLITKSMPSILSIYPVVRWLNITPYQLIQVMRNLMLTSFIAINRLGPLISAGPSNAPLSTKKGLQQLQNQLELIDMLSSNVSYESTQAFAHQMIPLQNNPQLVALVKKQLAEEMIEKRLSEDIFMKDALSNINREELLATSRKGTANREGTSKTSTKGGSLRKRN